MCPSTQMCPSIQMCPSDGTGSDPGPPPAPATPIPAAPPAISPLIKLALPSLRAAPRWVHGCSPSQAQLSGLLGCPVCAGCGAGRRAGPWGRTQPGTGLGHRAHWGCLIPGWGQPHPPPIIHHPGPAHDAPGPSRGCSLVPGAPRHQGAPSPAPPISIPRDAGLSLPAWQSCSGLRTRCRHVGTPPPNHGPSSPRGETQQNFNFNVH